jgi:hypothetical protein
LRSRDLSPDQLAALGAFLSGMGSVTSAYFAIRFERKRGQKECEQRLAALREGIEIQRRKEGKA